eukprot:COSAG04_NODE_32959_length_188_cov_473.146067_1_plen_57_part_01
MGQYQHRPSETSCIECGVGKYVDVPSSSHESDCIECSVGRWYGGTGSADATDCIACG